jgi:hypothetical protein
MINNFKAKIFAKVSELLTKQHYNSVAIIMSYDINKEYFNDNTRKRFLDLVKQNINDDNENSIDEVQNTLKEDWNKNSVLSVFSKPIENITEDDIKAIETYPGYPQYINLEIFLKVAQWTINYISNNKLDNSVTSQITRILDESDLPHCYYSDLSKEEQFQIGVATYFDRFNTNLGNKIPTYEEFLNSPQLWNGIYFHALMEFLFFKCSSKNWKDHYFNHPDTNASSLYVQWYRLVNEGAFDIIQECLTKFNCHTKTLNTIFNKSRLRYANEKPQNLIKFLQIFHNTMTKKISPATSQLVSNQLNIFGSDDWLDLEQHKDEIIAEFNKILNWSKPAKTKN